MLDVLRSRLTHPAILVVALLLPLVLGVLLAGGLPRGLDAEALNEWSPIQQPGPSTLAIYNGTGWLFLSGEPVVPVWFSQADTDTLKKFSAAIGQGDNTSAMGLGTVLASRFQAEGAGGELWSVFMPLMLGRLINANYGPMVLALAGFAMALVFTLPWFLRQPSDLVRPLAMVGMSLTAGALLFCLGYGLGNHYALLYGLVEYLCAATALFAVGEAIHLAIWGRDRAHAKAARDPLGRARNSNRPGAPRAATVAVAGSRAMEAGRDRNMPIGAPKGGKPWNPYDLPVGQDFRENARDYARMRTAMNEGATASVDVGEDADERVVHLRSVAEMRQERARATGRGGENGATGRGGENGTAGQDSDAELPPIEAAPDYPAIIGGSTEADELPAGTLDPQTGLPAHLTAAARRGFDLRHGFDPQVVAAMAAAAAAYRSSVTPADAYAQRMAPTAETRMAPMAPPPAAAPAQAAGPGDWMSGMMGTVRPTHAAAAADTPAERPHLGPMEPHEPTDDELMQMAMAMEVLGRIRPARPDPLEAIDEPDLPGAFRPAGHGGSAAVFAADEVIDAPPVGRTSDIVGSSDSAGGQEEAGGFLSKLSSLGRLR